MAKLFDTLEPKALNSLNDWKKLLSKSQDNLSNITSLLSQNEKMLSSVNNSLKASNDTAKVLEDTDGRIEEMTESIENLQKQRNENKLKMFDIENEDVLKNASFEQSYSEFEKNKYILREGLNSEELTNWFRQIDKKARELLNPAKAFFEDDIWKEELEEIEKVLSYDNMIDPIKEKQKTDIDTHEKTKAPDRNDISNKKETE